MAEDKQIAENWFNENDIKSHHLCLWVDLKFFCYNSTSDISTIRDLKKDSKRSERITKLFFIFDC